MRQNIFAERMRATMDAKKIKQIDIIRAAESQGIKLGKSHVSQYVSGKTIPRDNILNFLASVLEVEPDWLSGKTVDKTVVSDCDNEKQENSKLNSVMKRETVGDNRMREFKKLDRVFIKSNNTTNKIFNRYLYCLIPFILLILKMVINIIL